MNIGYFEDFKFGKTVLLDCAAHEVSQILSEIKKSVNSYEHSRLISQERGESPKDPISLYVVTSEKNVDVEHGNRFHWLLSVDQLVEIEAMLNALVSAGSGHQYFDLLQRDIQLMITVGEYGEEWWLERG